MRRSPNYGTRRPSKYVRTLYLTGIFRADDGRLILTAEGPSQPAFSFPARDDTHGIVLLDLLRQGAFSLPRNPSPFS